MLRALSEANEGAALAYGADRWTERATRVFARMPLEAARRLQQHDHFDVWDAEQGLVRWMTAFDTSNDDIDRFLRTISNTMRA